MSKALLSVLDAMLYNNLSRFFFRLILVRCIISIRVYFGYRCIDKLEPWLPCRCIEVIMSVIMSVYRAAALIMNQSEFKAVFHAILYC